MKNTIRCCISCILPCGALDVIRIVHANGRVEEISGSVKAEEIMKAHPKHVLKKPSSSYSSSSGDQDHDHQGMCRPKIVIVPPDAELQRGKIYFLMPLPNNSSEKTSSHNPKKKKKSKPPPVSTTTNTATTKPRSSSTSSSNINNSSSARRKKRELAGADHHHHHQSNIGRKNMNDNGNGNGIPVDNFLMSDRYLSEILSEKVSTQRDRRRGRAGVWRPNLESISESITSSPGDQAC